MAGLDPAIQLPLRARDEGIFLWRASARQMDGRLKGGHDEFELIPLNPKRPSRPEPPDPALAHRNDLHDAG